MRKICIIAVVSLLAINTYGQTFLGFKGSFNISGLTSGSSKSRPGFDVGAILLTPISDSWYFHPGFLFSLNGTKSSDTYNPHYSASFYSIETPLLLSYRLGDEEISFGFDAGVFARYGLFGSYWTDTNEGRVKPDIFDYQKRFDFGPQVGMSVIANNMYMACGLQYGVLKPWDHLRGRYLNYSVSFGYLFELY